VLADYAIERCCSHRGHRLQLDFARHAMQLLPRQSSTAFEMETRGLVIMADTELALERPVRRLTDAYGDMVRIDPPAVRYRHGQRIEQPIMGLRVRCAPEFYEPVREDLRLRRAAIVDAEINRRFGIVRASVPLVALIGCPDRFDGLTAGRGQLVMWLSHYEEIEDPPPAGVAA
jgi:predicted membrane GTPase involved in stress response